MISVRALLKRIRLERRQRRQPSAKNVSINAFCQKLEVRSLLTSTIQGQIWEDLDLDGIFDEDESFRNGVRLDLKSLSGDVLQTTVSADVDLNNNGVIDPLLERGIYQFDVDDSTAYTVVPSELGFDAITNPAAERKVGAAAENVSDRSDINEIMGTVYSGGRSGIVSEYHVASNAVTRKFDVGEHISGVAVSPDGTSLAVSERNLRDDLITVHIIDLQSGNTESWQHDPAGTANGIWHLGWSADNQLFLGLAAQSSPDDRQLLTFDLDSKQFTFNRTVSYGSSLLTTANGQSTILTGLGDTQDEVAVYSATTGRWTDISPDVARIRSGGFAAINSTADRFVIRNANSNVNEVVDENFETLFQLPDGFRTFGFRTNEDSLLGYIKQTQQPVKYDSNTGAELPVDFNADNQTYGKSVMVQGTEYFLSKSYVEFFRREAALIPTAAQQIFVQTGQATETIVPAIGTATPAVLLNPDASSFTVTEGGPAQQIHVLLNQKPTADVVINIAVADETEVDVDRVQLTITPDNWQTLQLIQISGLDDDLLDRTVISNVFLSIDAANSAAEFSNVQPVTLRVSTLDRDSSLRGRVTSNAHIYNVDYSDWEYLNGITIDLFDELNNLVATTETMSYDINLDGVIQDSTEKGWYRFDLLDPGYYTVVQRGVGPAGQPTPLTWGGFGRWIESTATETGVLDPVRPYAYATTETGEVARQDTRATRQALVLDVGERAQGVAVSQAGEYLYVGEGSAQTGGFRIHRMDLSTLQYESFDLPMSGGPYSVKELKLRPGGQLLASVVDADGRHTILSVDNLDSSALVQSLYEADSFRSIIEFTDDGNRVLMSTALDGSSALVYDLQAQQSIATADPSIQPLAMNATGDRIFAQSLNREAVLLDGNFQRLHVFGIFNAGGAFSADQTTMYLGNGFDGTLQRIDLETLEVLDESMIRLPNTGRPMVFQLSPNEDDLLVDNDFFYVFRIDPFGSQAGVHAINLEEAQVDFGLDFTRISPRISVSAFPEGFDLKEEGGQSRTLDFRLSHAPTSDVHVVVSGTDETELQVDEQTFVFTADNWMIDQTIVVQAVDDDLPDGDRLSQVEFRIDVSASDALYSESGVQTVSVTTLDNENLISGRIWQDSNGDGIFDPGEVGQNGRTVELVDLDLNVVRTAVTESIDLNENGQIEPNTETGWYRFINVPEGSLFVRQLDVNQQGQTQPVSDFTTLIDVFDVQQHAYSSVTDIAYIADYKTGELHRYHVGLQLQLNPIPLGGRPNSIDVSADGQTLWIGDATANAAAGIIRSVNLLTGQVTTFHFDQRIDEVGVSEIAAMDNGSILFTSLTLRSNGRLLQLDPETGTVAIRQESDRAILFSRSADHKTAVVATVNGEKPVFRYDSMTDRLTNVGPLVIQGSGQSLAVSHDGQLMAFETFTSKIVIYNRSLQQLVEVTDSIGDFIFHPSEPILYVLSADGLAIQAFDAITGEQIGSDPLPTQTGNASRFALGISDDGRNVFFQSSAGFLTVRVNDLPSDIPAGLPFTVQNGDFVDTLDLGRTDPGVAFFPTSQTQTMEEGQTSEIGLLRLTERPEAEVQVTVANSDSSTLVLQNSVYTFTPANWNQWQPLIASAPTDGVSDGDQAVDLTVSVDSANSHETFANAETIALQVSVVDIDTPGISVSTANVFLAEGQSTNEVAVSLLHPPSGDVRLLITADVSGILNVETTELVFTADNWNVPQAITISAVQNGRIEDRRIVTVSIAVDVANSSAGYSLVEDSTISVQVDNSNILHVEQWRSLANGETQVSWDVPDDDFKSGPFEVQIVSLDDGPDVVFSEVVNAEVSSIVIPKTFDNGSYRIWVRGTLADGRWSPWSNRAVVQNAAPEIESAGYHPTSDDLEIHWPTVGGAVSYRVFVSNISTAEAGIVDTIVAENSISLPDLKQLGRLRIWIQAVTANGLRSSWSAFADVTLLVEGVGPKWYFSGNQPRFEWTSVEGAASHELYISKLQSNQQLHFKNITSTRYFVEEPLESGTYRWWVRGTTADGKSTEWSEGYDVTIGDVTLLTERTVAANLNTPVFEWHEVSTAAYYDLYVQEDFGDQTVTRYNGLTERSVQMAPLSPGWHNVWVRAVDENGNGKWGPKTRYYVGDAGLDSEVDNLVTAPVTFRQERDFSFTHSAVVAEIDLIVIGPERNHIYKGIRVTGSETTITFSVAFPVAEYRWAVRHRTADGLLGQWKYGNNFRNDGRIPLDVPTTFAEGEPVVFSWPEVKNAAGYSMQIDNINTGEQNVVRIDRFTQPQYESAINFSKARYRVWVRAILSTGELAPWSLPDEFEVV